MADNILSLHFVDEEPAGGQTVVYAHADNAPGGSGYTLPVATASVLGGVKSGAKVTVRTDATMEVADGSVEPAHLAGYDAGTGHGKVPQVKADGSGFDFVAMPAAYALPAAKAQALGGVKLGAAVAAVAHADAATSAAAPVKAEFDNCVAVANECKRQLNALIASLKASGAIA